MAPLVMPRLSEFSVQTSFVIPPLFGRYKAIESRWTSKSYLSPPPTKRISQSLCCSPGLSRCFPSCF